MKAPNDSGKLGPHRIFNDICTIMQHQIFDALATREQTMRRLFKRYYLDYGQWKIQKRLQLSSTNDNQPSFQTVKPSRSLTLCLL